SKREKSQDERSLHADQLGLPPGRVSQKARIPGGAPRLAKIDRAACCVDPRRSVPVPTISRFYGGVYLSALSRIRPCLRCFRRAAFRFDKSFGKTPRCVPCCSLLRPSDS